MSESAPPSDPDRAAGAQPGATRPGAAPREPRVSNMVGIAAGAATVVASAIALLSFLGFGPIGGGGSQSQSASASASGSQEEPVSAAGLARAVVLIRMISADGLVGTASGTIIDPTGLILTNAHVAAPTDVDITELEVGLTMASDTPAAPAYHAELVASDQLLDLAVIRIFETIDGGPVTASFPFVSVGDSDNLEIGDTITVLGYPGIGGDTITLTSGQVSGFTGDAILGFRAWIKTNAEITGGNSGGLAANDAGEIIGVPTRAGTTSDIVDCRPIRDTNRDGEVNELDDCVPIGGFINGLRPIGFAATMIDAAIHGLAYVPLGEGPGASGEPSPDVSQVSWEAPTFTSAVTESNEAVDDVEWLATGAPRVCAVWAYDGMEAGMRWEAIWSVDGELVADFSYLDQSWGLGSAGNFWVCATNEQGLAPGVYDVALTVEDESQLGGFVAIGDEFAPVDVVVENGSDQTVCFLYLSPSLSGSWGRDRLGSEDVLEAGESITFAVPVGTYDLLGRDCDGEDLFTQLSVEVAPGTTLAFP